MIEDDKYLTFHFSSDYITSLIPRCPSSSWIQLMLAMSFQSTIIIRSSSWHVKSFDYDVIAYTTSHTLNSSSLAHSKCTTILGFLVVVLGVSTNAKFVLVNWTVTTIYRTPFCNAMKQFVGPISGGNHLSRWIPIKTRNKIKNFDLIATRPQIAFGFEWTVVLSSKCHAREQLNLLFNGIGIQIMFYERLINKLHYADLCIDTCRDSSR